MAMRTCRCAASRWGFGWSDGRRAVRSLFVTGTDTGVGKTVAVAALLARARDMGVDAVPMKPVQTGCRRRGGALVAMDAAFALRMARWEPPPEERELIAPCRFRLAASPHLAAAVEGHRISLARIVYRFRRLQARHTMVLVEGAGGVLVPLNESATMRDLMVALGLPVLLVARTGLGTLNHTLLSLDALRAAGLEVAGIWLCPASGARPGIVERDNAAVLTARAGVPVWGPIPRMVQRSGSGFAPAAFARTTAPVASACLAEVFGGHALADYE
jgi:dethiobiotin synthetase